MGTAVIQLLSGLGRPAMRSVPAISGLLAGLAVGLAVLWPGYGRTRILDIALTSVNYPAELVEIDRQLAQGRSLAFAHSRRGRAFLFLLDYPRAIEEFTVASALAPDSPLPYFWRSVAHLRLQNWEAAVADLTEVIERDDEESPAYFNRALALQRLARWNEAADDLEAYLNREPHYGDRLSIEARIERLRRLDAARSTP